jgi:hypothetical protein
MMAEFLGGMIFASAGWIAGLATLFILNKRGKLGRFSFIIEAKPKQP